MRIRFTYTRDIQREGDAPVEVDDARGQFLIGQRRAVLVVDPPKPARKTAANKTATKRASGRH